MGCVCRVVRLVGLMLLVLFIVGLLGFFLVLVGVFVEVWLIRCLVYVCWVYLGLGLLRWWFDCYCV